MLFFLRYTTPLLSTTVTFAPSLCLLSYATHCTAQPLELNPLGLQLAPHCHKLCKSQSFSECCGPKQTLPNIPWDHRKHITAGVPTFVQFIVFQREYSILEHGISLRFSDWYSVFVLDSVLCRSSPKLVLSLEYQMMDRVQETSMSSRMSTSTHSKPFFWSGKFQGWKNMLHCY
jgi:hypothetical protein